MRVCPLIHALSGDKGGFMFCLALYVFNYKTQLEIRNAEVYGFEVLEK